jgi:hypothetical protein
VFTWFGELDRQEPEYHIHPYQNWVELFGIGSRTRIKIYIFKESNVELEFLFHLCVELKPKLKLRFLGKKIS